MSLAWAGGGKKKTRGKEKLLNRKRKNINLYLYVLSFLIKQEKIVDA